MLSSALLHPIDMDQFGNAVADGTEVWTGSLPNGTFDSSHSQCLGWTSSVQTDRATAGDSFTTDSTWVWAPASGPPWDGYWCDDHHPVYCFQQ